MSQQSSAPSASGDLHRELLRLVLASTLKKNGIPPHWISGEINAMISPAGEELIEVRLSVQVDEPRFVGYLSSFQADFLRRLLLIAPEAKKWLSGVVWSLHMDPTFEIPLPSADYWEHVIADRELSARQTGAMDWDRDTLARHFSDTNPGDLVVDYADTNPPDRGLEDLAPPTPRKFGRG